MNMTKALTVVLLFAASFLFAQKTTKFTVQISGYTEGATIKLLGVAFDQNFLADTAKLDAKGSATFVKAEGFKEGLYYLLTPDKNNFQFIIANGENDFTLKTSNDNLILGMSVDGSTENELLFTNIRYQVALEEKFNALSQQMGNIQPNTPQYYSIFWTENRIKTRFGKR